MEILLPNTRYAGSRETCPQDRSVYIYIRLYLIYYLYLNICINISKIICESCIRECRADYSEQTETFSVHNMHMYLNCQFPFSVYGFFYKGYLSIDADHV